MLSNYAISAIRTYVPIGVGALLAFLALHFGIVVDDKTEAALAVPLTAVLTGLYWTVVRLVEKKWPKAGLLLGVQAQPQYVTPANMHTDGGPGA